MTHSNRHPLAGNMVTVKMQNGLSGKDVSPVTYEFWLEDWWDRLTGSSWKHAVGNPAALKYAMRSGFTGLPTDDEVVYGKIGGLGHLVHASEINWPEDRPA